MPLANNIPQALLTTSFSPMKILVVVGFACVIAAVLSRPESKKRSKPTHPPHPHGGTGTPPSHHHGGTEGPHGGHHGTHKPGGSGSSEEGHHHGHHDNCQHHTTHMPIDSSSGHFSP